MVSKSRAKRIADRIKEEISEMLIFDFKDPRVTNAYITDVSVDRELAFADIYIFSLSGTESADDVLAGFRHASGYLRSELASRIELRTFPRLRFHWDPTPERAEYIEKIIDSISREDTGKEISGDE